jgi:predicted enzyme related to lactoylglutathione lyase
MYDKHTPMDHHHKINYVELPSKDISATKEFYHQVFGWTFVDYGPDYIAVEGAHLDAGFYKADLSSKAHSGAALVVLFSNQLEESLELVKNNGGLVLKEIFSFPGGRRFEFEDPTGNQLAVWSDK